jgi:hypothetical protein
MTWLPRVPRTFSGEEPVVLAGPAGVPKLPELLLAAAAAAVVVAAAAVAAAACEAAGGAAAWLLGTDAEPMAELLCAGAWGRAGAAASPG